MTATKPTAAQEPYTTGKRVEVLIQNFDKPGFPMEWEAGTVDEHRTEDSGRIDMRVKLDKGGFAPRQIIGTRGGNKSVRPVAEGGGEATKPAGDLPDSVRQFIADAPSTSVKGTHITRKKEGRAPTFAHYLIHDGKQFRFNSLKQAREFLKETFPDAKLDTELGKSVRDEKSAPASDQPATAPAAPKLRRAQITTLRQLLTKGDQGGYIDTIRDENELKERGLVAEMERGPSGVAFGGGARKFTLTEAGIEALRADDPDWFAKHEQRQQAAADKAAQQRAATDARREASAKRAAEIEAQAIAEGLDPLTAKLGGMEAARKKKRDEEAQAAADADAALRLGVPDYRPGEGGSMGENFRAVSAAGPKIMKMMTKDGFTPDEARAAAGQQARDFSDAMGRLDKARTDLDAATDRLDYVEDAIKLDPDGDYTAVRQEALDDRNAAVRARVAVRDEAKKARDALGQAVVAAYEARGRRKTVAALKLPDPNDSYGQGAPRLLARVDAVVPASDLPSAGRARQAVAARMRIEDEITNAQTRKKRHEDKASRIMRYEGGDSPYPSEERTKARERAQAEKAKAAEVGRQITALREELRQAQTRERGALDTLQVESARYGTAPGTKSVPEIQAAIGSVAGNHRDPEWAPGIRRALGLPDPGDGPMMNHERIDVAPQDVRFGDFVSKSNGSTFGFQVAGIDRRPNGDLILSGPGLMGLSQLTIKSGDATDLKVWRPGVSDQNRAPLRPEEDDLPLMARRMLESFEDDDDRWDAANRLRASKGMPEKPRPEKPVAGNTTPFGSHSTPNSAMQPSDREGERVEVRAQGKSVQGVVVGQVGGIPRAGNSFLVVRHDDGSFQTYDTRVTHKVNTTSDDTPTGGRLPNVDTSDMERQRRIAANVEALRTRGTGRSAATGRVMTPQPVRPIGAPAGQKVERAAAQIRLSIQSGDVGAVEAELKPLTLAELVEVSNALSIVPPSRRTKATVAGGIITRAQSVANSRALRGSLADDWRGESGGRDSMMAARSGESVSPQGGLDTSRDNREDGGMTATPTPVTLKGTTKQKQWAADIRSAVVDRLERARAAMHAKARPGKDMSQVDAVFDKHIADLNRRSDAKWWIDNRNGVSRDIEEKVRTEVANPWFKVSGQVLSKLDVPPTSAQRDRMAADTQRREQERAGARRSAPAASRPTAPTPQGAPPQVRPVSAEQERELWGRLAAARDEVAQLAGDDPDSRAERAAYAELKAVKEALLSAGLDPDNPPARTRRFGRGAGASAPSAPRGRDIAAKVDYKKLPATYNAKTGENDALKEIIRQQGFDAAPRVVSKTEFDAALSAGEVRETWRGLVGQVGGPKPAEMAEQYRTGSFYVGLGINGDGTYVAMNKSDGQTYGSTLLRIGLRRDARVISADDLDAEMDAYFAKVDTRGKNAELDQLDAKLLRDLAAARTPRDRANVRRKYRDNVFGLDADKSIAVQRDPGIFAALRGYDAIEISKDRSPDKHHEMIILNRGATIVEEA